MGKFFRSVMVLYSSLFVLSLMSGCSSGSATRATNFPIPANVGLTPTNIVSLNLGSTQLFTASPKNNKGTPVITPVSFQSSNTGVVTVATNGNVCAGSWDSLSNPQICTPGSVGVAQVIAFSHGVTSPPTTVYVHQPIDQILVSPVPGQPTPQSSTCFSKDQSFNYQAAALSRGVDITSTVGTFTWQLQNSSVAQLSTTASGLQTGQAQVKAQTPGVTSIFASASNVNSLPFAFTTCAVQSITLTVNGSPTNSIVVSKGTSTSITTTVVDTLGNTITGIPLSWCSSDPAIAGIGSSSSGNCSSNTGSSVSISSSLAGGATITASCTPPNCNIGFQPSLPIYPQSALALTITPSGTTAQTVTTYVSSVDCGIADGCTTLLIPLTSPNNTPGTTISLPATPNSMVFDPSGAKAYLGTDFAFFGSRGLMQITATATPPTVAQFPSVIGKVLAVSPDGKKVILSGADPNTAPVAGTPASTQVIIFDTTNGTPSTLPIAGATAAAFSPDALKAFIIARNTLYVYSTQDALQTIPLAAPASDVAFLSNGIAGYMAGGDPAGASFLPTCDLPSSPPVQGVANATGITMLRPLPDGMTLLALNPPGIETITATISGSPSAGSTNSKDTTGCPDPRGFLALNNTVNPGIDFGQGSFVPTQLILSSDGSTAYVLGQTPPPTSQPLSDILVFNIGGHTSSAIALLGSAQPTQATLSPDGSLLYVAATDGAVHIVDTQTPRDIQQVTFTQNPATLLGGLCTGVTRTCKPNLIAARP
jgi:hypothetical protein